MENVISKETADENVEQLLTFYDVVPDDMPDDIRKAIETSLNKIRRGIMSGLLQIDIEGKNIKIIQNIDDPQAGVPSTITYGKVKGNAKIGMKDDQPMYVRIYNLLGALSGEGIKVIQRLEGKDLSLAEALGTVFLQT